MIHHLKAIIGFQEKEEVKIESMSDRKKKPKKMKKRNEREAEGGDKEVLKTRVQDLELSARNA